MERGEQILLVEDDPATRDAVALALELEGYAVFGAADGAEALARLRSGPPPRLILLDLMMPVLDGWTFRARQQQDPALASIPVVVVSADGSVPQKAAALGAADHLTKPIDVGQLLQTVKRHC
jgi:CheY-like chemotaxis protein